MAPKNRIVLALKIWAVIYPSITLFLFVLGDSMSGLPLYLRTFILTISLVPWMVFAALPLLEKVLRFLTKNRTQKFTS